MVAAACAVMKLASTSNANKAMVHLAHPLRLGDCMKICMNKKLDCCDVAPC